MGGLRVSNEVLLAKTETTYNTDSVPVAGTNAILVRNFAWAQEALRMVDREAIRGSIGQLQKIYGGELRKFTFDCEVKGSGTAGTAPEIGPLLEACGFEETIVGGTSVTYKPESDAHESLSMYGFEGGRKRHIVTGCRGTVSLALEAGGILVASFEFIGHLASITDQTQPTPTYNATAPRTALGMTVSFNGVTAFVPRKWTLSPNNVLSPGMALNTADGYGPVDLTKRDVTGSLEIETELDSVLDVDALLAAGTRFAFQAGSLGSVAGNIVTVSTPASSTYIMGTSPGEDAGKRLRTIEFGVDDSTPNQEISIVFT